MGTSVLLVLASSTLYAACFPPWSLSALVWIALVPLLVALTRQGPLGGALLGLLWGTGIGVETGLWFPDMVSTYFEQPIWVGWVSLPAIGMAHAGAYCAAFGAVVGWMVRARVVTPIRVAVAWAGFEIARANAFGGDPWALTAYALVHWPMFIQTADLAGPYAGGLLVAAVNAGLAAALIPALRGARPGRSAMIIVAGFVATLAYGWWRLDAASSPPTTRVAVVQGGVGRALRWRPEYQRLGLAEHLERTAAIAAVAPALVVWPEYAVSFYPEEASAERTDLLAGVRRFGADVVLGAPHYEFTPDGATTYHNSVFLLRDGGITGRYDKRRLVPFAETTGDTRYTPGTAPGVLPSAVGRLGVLVCFEAMYPDLARETVGAGAEILLNLSNDSWFGSESAARHHLEMSTFRAIETRRWLIRAATTGYSALVDPAGRMVATTAFGRPDVLLGGVTPRDDVTLYGRVGDVPLLVLLVLTVVGTLRELAWRRHDPPW